MAQLIALVSKSGFGKSTSIGENKVLGIKGLNPKETVLINVMGKPLPFPGWKKMYNSENTPKNYLESRDPGLIMKVLQTIKTREDVKHIVIDDLVYLMSGEFMDKSQDKGYDKFTSIAKNIWDILNFCSSLPEHIKVYFLTHEEVVTENFEPLRKIKTLGKMLDNVVTLEGLFTIVLFGETKVKGKKIEKFFVTQSDGTTTAKSPYGMFDHEIPNDLGFISDKVDAYNNQ